VFGLKLYGGVAGIGLRLYIPYVSAVRLDLSVGSGVRGGFGTNPKPLRAARFRLIAWLRKSSTAAISPQTTEETLLTR
jgi:hypothetical protein